ncbi:hypothetical protein OS493_016421 [Desmophyllum pertusum]|uniref:Uncharacterized protein n=1 Tax=Desmophyllum pertusum TaxID=174260 RepID=A0A9W9ZSV3_9CNID|nr:hypothetical protein OS493_016421 [Desmophyllum pertusum]
MAKYPGSVSFDDLKKECPVFGDKVCPFAKLPEEKKGMAGKCPAFKGGCPFKECKSVGEFEAKLGKMRDECKGDAAYVQFLRDIHTTAKKKEAGVGTACPFFQTKGGCPLAKDTAGKPILSPDYIVTPMGFTLNDAMFKCPAFGKGYPGSVSFDDLKKDCPVFGDKVCPFAKLPEEKKGTASKCPAFKNGCPFKECESVGEFEAKLGKMRDECKGDAAYVQFLRDIHTTAKKKEAAFGVGTACPFFQTEDGCPFAKDTSGNPILSPDYIAYPGSVSFNDLKKDCPVFGDKVCPFAKLPEEKKGMAGKCPAFKGGCPFKECKSVGNFEAKLGQMRDECNGDAAYVQFLRDIHTTAKKKEAGVGTACPFFQTKGGCPFAKDTSGKPILSLDYIAVCLFLCIFNLSARTLTAYIPF